MGKKNNIDAEGNVFSDRLYMVFKREKNTSVESQLFDFFLGLNQWKVVYLWVGESKMKIYLRKLINTKL